MQPQQGITAVELRSNFQANQVTTHFILTHLTTAGGLPFANDFPPLQRTNAHGDVVKCVAPHTTRRLPIPTPNGPQHPPPRSQFAIVQLSTLLLACT